MPEIASYWQANKELRLPGRRVFSFGDLELGAPWPFLMAKYHEI